MNPHLRWKISDPLNGCETLTNLKYLDLTGEILRGFEKLDANLENINAGCHPLSVNEVRKVRFDISRALSELQDRMTRCRVFPYFFTPTDVDIERMFSRSPNSRCSEADGV
jgi:hypothetical protein